jgi:general stress protein 26
MAICLQFRTRLLMAWLKIEAREQAAARAAAVGEGALVGELAYEKANELLRGISVGMLITRSVDGDVHVRPMNLRNEAPPFTGELWFFTTRGSRKVEEIQHAPVSLIFQDAATRTYVHLRGWASVEDDRAKLEELWDPVHRAWYPGGVDDADLLLLHVWLTNGDYWIAASPAATAQQTHEAAETTEKGRLCFV